VGEQHDSGGQAFPLSEFPGVTNDGMTLLDWFAGQALAGLAAEPELSSERVAEIAYDCAERMVAEKRRREADGGGA